MKDKQMSEEKKKKLTDKEDMFCREFTKDFNGARAARDAGYSEKTARQIATTLLSKVHIRNKISSLLEPRMKYLEISSDRVGQELAAIGFAELAALPEYDERGNVKRYSLEQIKDKLKALEMLAKHTKFFEDVAPVENNTTNNTYLSGLPTDKLKRIVEILDEDEGEE